MSKIAFARILTLVALLTSGWMLLAGIIAPFGAVGVGAFVLLVTAGIASFAAVIIAARQPRQVVILGITCLLSLGHILLWLWIALISFSGGV
jgi:hypothetical protein